MVPIDKRESLLIFSTTVGFCGLPFQTFIFHRKTKVCEAPEARNGTSETCFAASELQILPDGTREAPLRGNHKKPIGKRNVFLQRIVKDSVGFRRIVRIPCESAPRKPSFPLGK